MQIKNRQEKTLQKMEEKINKYEEREKFNMNDQKVYK
jgi:hypothetical protein